MIELSPARLQVSAGGEGGRLRPYLICLSLAFASYILVHGLWNGTGFLLVCLTVLASLVVALVLLPSGARGRRVVGLVATVAASCALMVPLAALTAAGVPVSVAVTQSTVWPQILVALFAARILSELAELRLAAFWRHPLEGSGGVGTQSTAAAFIFGCCLTLIFYQLVGGFTPPPERLDPWAIFVRAFTGQTAIHTAIVLLFFVVMAAIMDATLILANDLVALGGLRRACRESMTRDGITRVGLAKTAEAALAPFVHTRTARIVAEALEKDGARGLDDGALAVLHGASRRLLRALVSFLPLMGFLGTVIGLTAAIGGLPRDLGSGAAGTIDIGASLLGLAVKFETTLLGLAGGLAASLLLALLEKREEELAAECMRLVEACSDAR